MATWPVSEGEARASQPTPPFQPANAQPHSMAFHFLQLYKTVTGDSGTVGRDSGVACHAMCPFCLSLLPALCAFHFLILHIHLSFNPNSVAFVWPFCLLGPAVCGLLALAAFICLSFSFFLLSCLQSVLSSSSCPHSSSSLSSQASFLFISSLSFHSLIHFIISSVLYFICPIINQNPQMRDE